MATHADSLADYLRSPSNRKLLYTFAVDKLAKLAFDKESVGHAVNLALDDAIDSAVDKYTSWTLTPENIAEVNAEVYKALKLSIERTLKAKVADPETEIANRFKERTKPQTFEKSDGIIQDRELEGLRETYLNSWR